MTCATDGNHGRSVAWGAQTFGCRCVIYVHETVSEGRCRAIAAYGAEVRRVAGTYDDAVRRAAADAAAQGWTVVSDTSYEGYTDVPRDVMQGYSLMVEEALAQAATLPSHVFVQGGVGGLAAGVCSYLWERYGAARPRFVVVEPDKADCLYRSAVAGRPTPAEGALDTIMAGLACGEVSILAWRILEQGTDAFMTIGDDAAADCMRLLADGRLRRRSGRGRGIGRGRARRPAAGERRCGCARTPRSAPGCARSGLRHRRRHRRGGLPQRSSAVRPTRSSRDGRQS